ncbi:MAG: pyridoxal phosphate-dependent aminotransferase [Rhodocyclaceae bacterium]|nr:pyridoxal phosphate-dependent aminotransferase [Rhodocyclaceae bacterium]MCA3082682.1 pyridoxal phosphate-dependent aminotransferase [Rhodocyclaceae bacterium]
MNEKRLSKRMSHIQPFQAMEIQSRARVLELAGHDVIHMEIGEPDFGTPLPVIEAGKRALDEQPMWYTRALGLMPLREAIAKFYQNKYGVTIDPERVIVTAGSSAALLLAFAALLNDGDEVLMSDPGYPCNRHFVRSMNGVPVQVPVGAAGDFQMTATDISTRWGIHTAAALIASPANPTGTLIADEELRKIHQAVTERGGSLIVDEIYQGLTYDSAPSTALSILDHADNVFIVNSFSKYFHMTGWRLGWMVVPKAYVKEMETLAQNLFISPSTPAQYAAMAAFLPETLGILEARRCELKKRRDFLVPALEAISFQVPAKPGGAFYVYADTSAVAEDSFHLSSTLLEKALVAMTPGRDFGVNQRERYMRIAYTQPIARLEDAVDRIRRSLVTGG